MGQQEIEKVNARKLLKIVGKIILARVPGRALVGRHGAQGAVILRSRRSLAWIRLSIAKRLHSRVNRSIQRFSSKRWVLCPLELAWLGGVGLITPKLLKQVLPSLQVLVIVDVPNAQLLRVGLRKKVAGIAVIAAVSVMIEGENLPGAKAVTQRCEVVSNAVAAANDEW